MGPLSTAVTGFAARSSEPERSIVPIPIAWRSPLTTSGARDRIPDIAWTSRSCWPSHPACQYSFGTVVVSPPAAGSRTSGYHSPHFPALHPIGFDGAWTRWLTPAAAVRRTSHSSTAASTKAADGPSVIVRRTS